MDTTLAINPGSSSKKYAFFHGDTEVCAIRFERTGDGFGKCVSLHGVQNLCESIQGVAYEEGLRECIAIALREKVIQSVEDITAVGIRIVAPHSFFTQHRIIDAYTLRLLQSLKTVAPLHVPHVLEEIMAAERELPHARRIGVSDSAFHTTMPSHASLYSVPTSDCEEHNVYRFGYHGLSVSSVTNDVVVHHGAMPPRMIVVHIGSGVSVTAVKEGKSIDTTMGLSPASGLIMGSRGGDIDAATLIHIAREKKLSLDEAERYLNTMTGLKGLLGTNDLRIVLDRARRGEFRAVRALDTFIYHIHKAIHAYVGVLGGIDALVLTATAAERNSYVRTRIASALTERGCILDEAENERLCERAGRIHTSESAVAVYLIPTQEMREIARSLRTVS